MIFVPSVDMARGGRVAGPRSAEAVEKQYKRSVNELKNGYIKSKDTCYAVVGPGGNTVLRPKGCRVRTYEVPGKKDEYEVYDKNGDLVNDVRFDEGVGEYTVRLQVAPRPPVGKEWPAGDPHHGLRDSIIFTVDTSIQHTTVERGILSKALLLTSADAVRGPDPLSFNV